MYNEFFLNIFLMFLYFIKYTKYYFKNVQLIAKIKNIEATMW